MARCFAVKPSGGRRNQRTYINRLTTILLDIFEDQLKIGKLVVIADARRLHDSHLRNLNRQVLASGGHVKMADAKKYAEHQYEKFNAARKIERQKGFGDIGQRYVFPGGEITGPTPPHDQSGFAALEKRLFWRLIKDGIGFWYVPIPSRGD